MRLLYLLATTTAGATLLIVACGGGTTSPSPPPVTTPTPTSSPVVDGHRLFISKGCAACHGQNAEGTTIAPGLGGHAAEVIRRQVRAPVGIMPVFPPDKLSNPELDSIVAYISSLPGEHGHPEGADIGQEIALHHWMALLSLQSGDSDEARHHVDHIIQLTEGDHRARMQLVLEKLQEDNVHDAEHDIQDMLAGTASPDLSPQEMHLQLALSAIRVSDAPNILHQMGHFLDLATGEELDRARAIMGMLEQDQLRSAQREIEELLQVSAPDQHGDDSHDQEAEGHHQ